MKKVFEILSMIALIIWGAMFLYFYDSGRVNDFLGESFRIWVPIAGGGLILLGLGNLVTVHCSAGHHHDHHDHDHDHHHHDHDHHHHDHDHDHSHCDHEDHHSHDHIHDHDDTTASSLAFALIVLLVPLLSTAKFSEERFSRDYTMKWAKIEVDMKRMRQKEAGARRAETNPYSDPDGSRGGGAADSASGDDGWGEFTLEDLKKMVPQTPDGDFLLDIPQIFYTAGDEELMNVMEGISVETIAQVLEDTFEGSHANRLRAYRLLIECCAADARPLSIPIDFVEELPAYEEMGWYKLIGRLHFQQDSQYEFIPVLQIKNFIPTPEPANWMAY